MDDYKVEEIPMKDEYLMAIGRLMVNWNQLDAIFDLLLIKLMGCRMWDVRSHMIVVGMNFGNKVELVKSLADVQSADMQDFYDKLINKTLPKITKLQGTRNAITHYKWTSNEEGVRGVRMMAKGKLKITEDLIAIEELQKASAEMLFWSNELCHLLPFDEVFRTKST